jgi:hypothetical protein
MRGSLVLLLPKPIIGIPALVNSLTIFVVSSLIIIRAKWGLVGQKKFIFFFLKFASVEVCKNKFAVIKPFTQLPV